MINEFLKSRIEDAKTLVQELNETYEYVSILVNYVKTKNVILALCLEMGTVHRVVDAEHVEVLAGHFAALIDEDVDARFG